MAETAQVLQMPKLVTISITVRRSKKSDTWFAQCSALDERGRVARKFRVSGPTEAACIQELAIKFGYFPST